MSNPVSRLVNPGLIQRTLREVLPSASVFALVLGGISALLSYAMPLVQQRFMSRAGGLGGNMIPATIQSFRNSVLGIDGAGNTIADIAFGIAWVHPVMLIPLLAQVIIACTRVPAGEIERGSIDILLGLPISRWELHISETIGWFISGALVLGSVYGGSYLGAQFIKPELWPNWGKLALVLGNLALVYTTIGSIALLAASISERRGRAIITVMIIAVMSLLINFLQLQWDEAKKFAFLSVLDYYKPGAILMRGVIPWRDLATLGGVSLGCWIIAGVVTSKRSMASL